MTSKPVIEDEFIESSMNNKLPWDRAYTECPECHLGVLVDMRKNGSAFFSKIQMSFPVKDIHFTVCSHCGVELWNEKDNSHNKHQMYKIETVLNYMIYSKMLNQQ